MNSSNPNANRRAIRVEHAGREVLIVRDENGIPHIDASRWLDALFGLGYAHAMDRTTQVLFSRAIASGRGAELIADKPELVETDRFFRRVGLHRHLSAESAATDDHVLEQIQAYCDGVNAGIQASGRSLPMWATGFRPAPWDAEAVLLVGKLLSFGGLAVSQMHNERLLIDLIHAGANETALRELFSPRLDKVDFDLLRQVHLSNQLSDDALDLIIDLPRLAGSNAWAVSPRRSASGKALLAADPHLEINRLPAIWYEVVLRWGDSYVMGASLPGCPLFAVARTEKVAWGVTYMKGDTIDYFIEDCRLSPDGRWQYRRNSSWHNFQVRVEPIGRKGAAPELMEVLENDQGILDGHPAQYGAGYYLSFLWTGNFGGGGRAIATWLDIVSAENTAHAMRIARDCPQPTLCFVFADIDGHIGMQGCGRFPKRPSPDEGLMPLPAWDPANHWQGFLSSALLPRVYDPPEGFVATANEEQNPLNGPMLVTQFLPNYRKRRIDERLQELPKATLQDMQALQYDLVSLQARDLLEVFLPHLPDGPIKQRLESWDCRYDSDSLEASLFQRLYVNVLIEVCGHEEVMGWRRALYICTRAGYSTMVLAAIDRQLRDQHSRWWRERDKGELIRRAASKLADYPDVPWRERNYFHFVNRFYSQGRVGKLFGIESSRMAMPGCHATPFQGHVMQTASHAQTFAPSYHLVTDLGTNEAWTNLPGGPSESPFSRFYRNEIERWQKGEYKCLSPTTTDRRPSS
jgi:penicillin amidase